MKTDKKSKVKRLSFCSDSRATVEWVAQKEKLERIIEWAKEVGQKVGVRPRV